MKEFINKYKSVLLYIFFGIFTTAVNVVSYQLLFLVLSVSNVMSTVIAWILSVIFAFVTNKLFVFCSRSFKLKVLISEAASFFGCRLITGLLDVLIMFFTVDLLHLNSFVWKIISNVIVIILNYITSKLFIFKTKCRPEHQTR